MVEVDVFSQLSTIMTIVIVLGGAIFGGVRWLNQQGDKKVARAKEEADKTANELKALTEHVATQMKASTAEVNREIMAKIDVVNGRVTEMLSDLRKRADLTNGNVATIRTEIQDLNDDLQELYDRVPEVPAHAGNGVAIAERLRKTKDREKKQRMKRRKIEQDRVEQSERYLSQTK